MRTLQSINFISKTNRQREDYYTQLERIFAVVVLRSYRKESVLMRTLQSIIFISKTNSQRENYYAQLERIFAVVVLGFPLCGCGPASVKIQLEGIPDMSP
ncbi:hypothetical protein AVEN_149189-1 [Araneus ventricosus]|uniref:Uncharacterized protein n=1 Tax=Araneus ventricosus TaxID=182803 RepID=A0A4Y2WZH0_ARAVE|nr:hypothetical protein AVEN_149189-1 [Araneus ventricosus]